jgi:hypothetical protein
MSHKPKSKTDMERRPPFREPRGRILIVCEGEKTEPNYFKEFRKKLRLLTVEIEIAGKECGSAPVSVVDYAIKMEEDAKNSSIKGNYDTVWCVMDVDNHGTLVAAIDKAKSHKSQNIEIALSNPCFEYWFLLHFKKTSRMINSSEASRALKKHFPKYEKSDPTTFHTFYPHTDTAIRNSKNIIRENHYGDDISGKDCNPCTHVHLVVEEIQSIANKQ